jgi:polysaccharide biosynthesis transport protein
LLSVATSYQTALTAQIRSLDQVLGANERRLSEIPAQEVTTARLEREADLLNELHTTLQTRLREAEVAEAVNLPSVRVVDAASLAFAPSSPNIKLNLVLGLVLGLAYGLALAFFREFRDHSVRERRDIEQKTGLAVLNMIPHIRADGNVLPVPELRARPITSGPEVGDHHAAFVPWPDRKGKAVQKRNKSFRLTKDREIALESFRALANDLRMATRQLGGGGRTVAITSAGRGEGKTLTACNLAMVRAAQGAKTLLIDADMRAQGVSKFFDCKSSKPGLTDFLSTGADPNGVLRGEVNGCEIWVMPAGSTGLYSGRLLESPKFKLLLERAKLQFDLIVVDTPPVNLITDAATVANCVDAVVMVVRGGVTDRESLDIAMERLERSGGIVVGAVMNDVKLPGYYAGRYAYANRWKVA